jgi:hypothetical protein
MSKQISPTMPGGKTSTGKQPGGDQLKEKMMPGQGPYTEEELKRKDELLRDAMDAEDEFGADELERFSANFRELEYRRLAQLFGLDADEFVRRCELRKDPFVIVVSMGKNIPEDEVTEADRKLVKDWSFGVSQGPPASDIVDPMNYFGPRGAATVRLTTREPPFQEIPTRRKKDGDGE